MLQNLWDQVSQQIAAYTPKIMIFLITIIVGYIIIKVIVKIINIQAHLRSQIKEIIND